jgi:hypothetical protein
MASAEKFAGDLRSAITDLLSSYERVQDLVMFGAVSDSLAIARMKA